MEKRKRRDVLVGVASAGAEIVLAALPANAAGRKPKSKEKEEVSPGEDLMREHGVLNRVLLIYDETTRRLEGQEDPRVDVLALAAGLIRRFIEGYHEKLEETELFPRFEKARKLVDLVTVLRQQHAAGRAVTEDILKLAVPATVGNTGNRTRLAGSLQTFIRMYRPHEAREDTVLFPAFHDLAEGARAPWRAVRGQGARASRGGRFREGRRPSRAAGAGPRHLRPCQVHAAMNGCTERMTPSSEGVRGQEAFVRAEPPNDRVVDTAVYARAGQRNPATVLQLFTPCVPPLNCAAHDRELGLNSSGAINSA